MKNISLFLTDCYGGRGGIAQYNRNLVDSLKSITLNARRPIKIQVKRNNPIKIFCIILRSI